MQKTLEELTGEQLLSLLILLVSRLGGSTTVTATSATKEAKIILGEDTARAKR